MNPPFSIFNRITLKEEKENSRLKLSRVEKVEQMASLSTDSPFGG
jgi:hypothetical protein